MFQWLWPILQNLGLYVSDDPTPINEDSKPNIDNIMSNHITIRFKHIYVPICYVHEQHVLLTIYPVKFRTIHSDRRYMH